QMAVTLPFVLILLDYWPLCRFPGSSHGSSDNVNVTQKRSSAQFAGGGATVKAHRFALLLLEKLPLLLLAAAASLITWLAQQQVAIRSLDDYPLSIRVSNALVSYCAYLVQMIWPVDLGVFYPHP